MRPIRGSRSTRPTVRHVSCVSVARCVSTYIGSPVASSASAIAPISASASAADSSPRPTCSVTAMWPASRQRFAASSASPGASMRPPPAEKSPASAAAAGSAPCTPS